MNTRARHVLWVAGGFIAPLAVAAIGVNAGRHAWVTAVSAAQTPASAGDSVPFAQDARVIEDLGYVAVVETGPAKITSGAAIRSARGFASAVSSGAGGVRAHRVKLYAPGRALGAPGSPISHLKTQGQTVWVVVFPGVTRSPARGNGNNHTPCPRCHGPSPRFNAEAFAAWVRNTPVPKPSMGTIVVLLDAQSGEFIEMISVSQDPENK